ncbi:MAG TPA: cation:proton antiporter [Candidatus Nanoarchaeia archaeon]|nr:cation:proton antiporter [Candidatus Nanoarchaeia archaeon]
MVSALILVFLALSLGYIFSEISKRLGLPRVVGQIFTGLILGVPIIKDYLLGEENLKIFSFLANLGIILLFYYVGLETNFRAFTKNIKELALISFFNTAIPLILGILIMKFVFGFTALISIIIGICLAVSAQSVSLDILEEMKALKSRIGNLIIGAGAVDDIIEIVLVAVIFSLFQVAVSHQSLLQLLLEILIFLVIIIASRNWIIPYGLSYFDREKSSTARFTGSLLIVILIASLAEFLGLGLILGAMIAGIIVRQTIFGEKKIPDWEEHDIANSVHLFSFGFLIPLFFVWVGMNADLTLIGSQIGFILLLLVISIVGTVGGSLIAVLLSGGQWREGWIVGWGLTPKGDIELVIAALALSSGIISTGIFTSLVITAFLTTVISSIMFKKLLGKTKSKLKGKAKIIKDRSHSVS